MGWLTQEYSPSCGLLLPPPVRFGFKPGALGCLTVSTKTLVSIVSRLPTRLNFFFISVCNACAVPFGRLAMKSYLSGGSSVCSGDDGCGQTHAAFVEITVQLFNSAMHPALRRILCHLHCRCHFRKILFLEIPQYHGDTVSFSQSRHGFIQQRRELIPS